MPTQDEPILSVEDGFYLRVGPYPGPGAMAFRYQCVDCDFSLVTVAASDLTAEDRAFLEQHTCTHISPTAGGDTSVRRRRRIYRFSVPIQPSNATNPFSGLGRVVFAVDEWAHRHGLAVVDHKNYLWLRRPWTVPFGWLCNWWDRRLGEVEHGD